MDGWDSGRDREGKTGGEAGGCQRGVGVVVVMVMQSLLIILSVI